MSKHKDAVVAELYVKVGSVRRDGKQVIRLHLRPEMPSRVVACEEFVEQLNRELREETEFADVGGTFSLSEADEATVRRFAETVKGRTQGELVAIARPVDFDLVVNELAKREDRQ